MALIILANAAANYQLAQLLEQPLSGVHFRSYLRVLKDEISVLMRERGIEVTADMLRARHGKSLPEIYVLNEHGIDIAGQLPPPPLQEHIALNVRNGWLPYSNKLPIPYRTIYGPDETPYRLVMNLHTFGKIYLFLQSYGSWLQILSAILVSGLVCFYLARYLVSPVQHLREATREFAAGNLGKRVGTAIGRRKDEIAGLGNDFDQMAERIELLMNAQKQLLRDISHELRSPLARLSVALGLVRQRDNEQIKAPLDRIERETDRLNDLIGQIISITRLETQADDLPLEPIDLKEILETVVQDAKYEAVNMQRDVELKNRFSVHMQANGELIHRALENVIRNALRYTPEHSRVEITMTKSAGEVCIDVRDYGPGVPEHALPRLFEPFVRVADARDRDSGGYGLGLAIAFSAVRAHGGSILAHNDKQQGFHITINLPTPPSRLQE